MDRARAVAEKINESCSEAEMVKIDAYFKVRARVRLTESCQSAGMQTANVYSHDYYCTTSGPSRRGRRCRQSHCFDEGKHAQAHARGRTTAWRIVYTGQFHR